MKIIIIKYNCPFSLIYITLKYLTKKYIFTFNQIKPFIKVNVPDPSILSFFQNPLKIEPSL